MPTLIKPELSKHSTYYLNRHRTYELRHFCMQYDTWQDELYSLNQLSSKNKIADDFLEYEDSTAQTAIAREHYLRRIHMIDKCCAESNKDIALYLRKGVTKGYTYEQLKLKYNIPCSRSEYYDSYRRFFWMLDKVRE